MKRAAAFVLAVVGLCILAMPGWAQTYPSRNVTIIVPYPAGGPTDQVARVLAQALQDKLKQNFIVENVSGGGTTIATGRVAHAAPDGYTLLIHNLQISANVALYKNVNYDTEKDLVPIIFINNNPLVLVGRKTLEPNNARRAAGADEKADAEGGDAGRRRDRPSRHLAARAGGQGQGRPNSVSRRRAGLAGYRRRPCRPVLRDTAVGGAAGQGRTNEGLRDHRKGKITRAADRRQLREGLRTQARNPLLARAVRAGRNTG